MRSGGVLIFEVVLLIPTAVLLLFGCDTRCSLALVSGVGTRQRRSELSHQLVSLLIPSCMRINVKQDVAVG